jgi:hypothetical protein
MRQQIIDAVCPLITFHREKLMTPDERIKYLNILLVVCVWRVLSVAVFFKRRAYKNEQEYRFEELSMTGTVPDIKYRARPYTLIRYKEFDWRGAAPGSLKKIVVGPASADSDKARQFSVDCLRRYHQEAVEICCSPIPYRAA